MPPGLDQSLRADLRANRTNPNDRIRSACRKCWCSKRRSVNMSKDDYNHMSIYCPATNQYRQISEQRCDVPGCVQNATARGKHNDEPVERFEYQVHELFVGEKGGLPVLLDVVHLGSCRNLCCRSRKKSNINIVGQSDECATLLTVVFLQETDRRTQHR